MYLDAASEALLSAFSDGNVSLAAEMLSAGGNIDACNADGQTPLMLAAQKGHRELIQLAVEGGAKLDLQDNTGKTALIHAAAAVSSYGGRSVRLLVEAGADPEIASHKGETALSVAESFGRGDNAEVLRQAPEIRAAYVRQSSLAQELAFLRQRRIAASRRDVLRNQARPLRPGRI